MKETFAFVIIFSSLIHLHLLATHVLCLYFLQTISGAYLARHSLEKMAQCKGFGKCESYNFILCFRKVYFGVNVFDGYSSRFRLYEVYVSQLLWTDWTDRKIDTLPSQVKEIDSPSLNEAFITSIKGQLYLFSTWNPYDLLSYAFKNSVFLLDAQNNWQVFEKDGNVTNIVEVLPYQS